MRQMLRQAVEDSRTNANSESVDDALQFIKDSLHCFHLYQGHRNRVINQQIGIAKVDEKNDRSSLADKGARYNDAGYY